MLTIRTAQLEEFRRVLSTNLHRRLCNHLRRALPVQTGSTSDEDLLAVVSAAVPRAREHGIVAEDDLRRYLEFVVRYGPAFGVDSRTAWAGEILRRRDLQAEEKLSLMDEYEIFGPAGSPS